LSSHSNFLSSRKLRLLVPRLFSVLNLTPAFSVLCLTRSLSVLRLLFGSLTDNRSLKYLTHGFFYKLNHWIARTIPILITSEPQVFPGNSDFVEAIFYSPPTPHLPLQVRINFKLQFGQNIPQN
jgi:hypothetical protein